MVRLTAVMPSGGEIAAIGTLAMQTDLLAGRLAQTIASYPTYALGLRVAAGRLFGEFGARHLAAPAATSERRQRRGGKRGGRR